jgi:hypothetical protein
VNKLELYAAGILTALSALILLAAEMTLLTRVSAESVPPVVVALHPGTTILSNYLPRISWGQRYEITVTNNTGIFAIARGDPGASCGAREMTVLLRDKSGTFHLPDFGPQTELCAVVTAGTPTMVISAKPFSEQ